MDARRWFGTLADGRDVEAIRLGTAGGLQAEVLTYGAILHGLSFPVAGRRRELVLRLDRVEDYENDRAYVGPVVGRFANRIARGRFSIDGTRHQLTTNENGNHLHGGALGTGKRLWRVRGEPTPTQAILQLHSPAAEEGYPGALDITLQLDLADNVLVIDLSAQCDAASPVNLTYHPYFNLGGDAADHWLRIPASRFLPVGPGLIPTGEIASVDGTPFDFRAGQVLRAPPPGAHPQLAAGGGFDHCWLIDAGADCHCELRSASRDVALTISGTRPGLQFYGGQFLSRTHPRIGTAIALEPQGLPDAPNHPAFPDAILRPGNTYRARIEYRVEALTPPR